MYKYELEKKATAKYRIKLHVVKENPLSIAKYDRTIFSKCLRIGKARFKSLLALTSTFAESTNVYIELQTLMMRINTFERVRPVFLFTMFPIV